MSQVSYGTITITDTTDLTTYIRYAKKTPLTAASDFQETPTTDTHFIAVLSIPSTSNIPAWNSNSWKWSEFIGTDGVSVIGTREIYYLKTNSATVAAPSDGSDISQTSKDVQNQWTKNVPTYVANGEYWSCIQTHLDASPTWVYGSPVLNQALTDTNYNAYLALSVSQHANEDAQGAMSQAASAVKEVKRIWFVKATNTSQVAPTTGVTSGSSSTYNAWSIVKPVENSAYPYYFYCDQTLTNGGLYSWSEVLLEADPYTVNALNVRTQNFFKGKDTTYDGWFASGRSESSGLNVANANTYYYNARFGATHITLGYNKTPVIDLNGADGSLDIYRLPTISGTSVTPGTLGVKLNGTALNFYNTNGTLTSSFGDTISLASNGASITIGSGQNEHITIDTNGLKIYGNYSYNNNGTSASMYGLLGSFGDSVQIGPSNTGHITLNTTGATFYDSAHTTIGVIGNTDLYYSAESYEEIVEVNWVSNETFTYDKQFDYDTIINSILIAIKNGDNIDWSSAQTATSPWRTVYINLGETMVPISISPSAVTGRTNCVFSSTDINPITDTILAFKINHTPSMPGPHYSFGISSIASGTGSFAAGVGIQAVGPYQMALGRYNKKDLDASFIIGNGSNDNNRSNLFVVDKEGNLSVKDGFKIVNDSDNFIELTTNAINFYNNQTSIASFGINSTRIGENSKQRVAISSSAVELYDGNNNKRVTVDSTTGLTLGIASTGHAIVNGTGLHIYDTNNKLAASTTTNGLVLYKAGSKRAAITANGMDIFGNDGNTVVATFGSNSAQIGKTAGAHTTIDEDGMQIYKSASVELANIGYGQGQSASGTANAPYYTFGQRKTSTSEYSSESTYVVGDMCIYNEKKYVCKKAIDTPKAWNSSDWGNPIGNYSFAEGINIISSSYCSHAEGNSTKSVGVSAHAEGHMTLASNTNAHAEGRETIASGEHAHAEGWGAVASNTGSHAEGQYTVASGAFAHAQNRGTVAHKYYQTAIGKWNSYDTGTGLSEKAFIIGNGTADDARSNALTVDWSGNVVASGNVTDGSGNVLANKKVDFSDAFNGSNLGYTVTVASLAGSTYLGQAIELGSVVANKYPLFNGFDILGSGTARIHTLGHYVYKDNNKWYAFVKMRNDNTSAITNFTVTAYIAWITV